MSNRTLIVSRMFTSGELMLLSKDHVDIGYLGEQFEIRFNPKLIPIETKVTVGNISMSLNGRLNQTPVSKFELSEVQAREVFREISDALELLEKMYLQMVHISSDFPVGDLGSLFG